MLSPKEQRLTLARAFRETTLSLIGLYQIYDVDQQVIDATADALARLFRRHLNHHAPSGDGGNQRCALHTLVVELDQILDARDAAP